MNACVKCKLAKPGSLHLNGGRLFHLCDHCAKESIPLHHINDLPEKWVATNIRLAKEARERGEGAWSKY